MKPQIHDSCHWLPLGGVASRTGIPLLIGITLLSGCTLGPDPQRPITVADGAEGFVHAPDNSDTDESTSLASTADLDAWWERFGDAATEDLVAQALAHNTDLRAAAARVLEAEAQLGSARSTLFPQLEAGVSASRSKNSFSLPEVGRVSVYSTTYDADLRLAYQVDLFGKLERTRQAAWTGLLSQRAARDTVTHSVIASVVRSRARISTSKRALDIAHRVRDSWKETASNIGRRYEAGLVPALDLRLARENLASAEANVVLVEQQLASARLVLDVLVGRRPGTGPELEALLAPLPDPGPIPLGLPADLLDRRPDLRQAEMALAASTARVGVAIADLFPSLSLTGSAGTASDQLSDLLSSDALIYNAVGSLLAPIFEGGRRRAEVDAARARAEQAQAVYAGAVLDALREVEDALIRDTAGHKRVAFLEQRLEEAKAADRIARSRYGRGVEQLLQVLDTERRLRQAEEALIQAQGQMWDVRVDLFLALGGNWTSEAPAEPSATSISGPSTTFSDDPPTSTANTGNNSTTSKEER